MWLVPSPIVSTTRERNIGESNSFFNPENTLFLAFLFLPSMQGKPYPSGGRVPTSKEGGTARGLRESPRGRSIRYGAAACPKTIAILGA